MAAKELIFICKSVVELHFSDMNWREAMCRKTGLWKTHSSMCLPTVFSNAQMGLAKNL